MEWMLGETVPEDSPVGLRYRSSQDPLGQNLPLEAKNPKGASSGWLPCLGANTFSGLRQAICVRVI